MDNYRNHPLYRSLDFDGIFGTTWELYKKYFGWLFFYSFVFSLLLSLPGLYLIDMDSVMQIETSQDISQLGKFMGNIMLYLLIVLLGYSLMYVILHNLIIRKEEDPGIRQDQLIIDSLSRYYLPYLAVVIITGIIMVVGAFLGLLALIIGSLVAVIYLSAVFMPVTPLLIIEKKDPISIIGRCFTLVHKNFWPTLAQVLVFLILFMLVSFIAGLLASAPYIGNIFSVLSDPEAAGELMESNRFMQLNNPLVLLLNAAVNGALLPFIPAFAVTVYFNLRAREDSSEPFGGEQLEM